MYPFRGWALSRSYSCWRSCAAVFRSRVETLSVSLCSPPSSVSRETRQMKVAWRCWASSFPWQLQWAGFQSWSVLPFGYRWGSKRQCVLTVNSCIDCDLWLCLWCAEDTSCVLRTPGAGAGRRLLQYGTRLCAHVTEYPQRQPTLLLPVYYCCHHPLWPLFRYFGITQNM